MGEFLITMGLGKGAFVTDFGFENVKLKWKAKKGHNNDCGVFVMIHQCCIVANHLNVTWVVQIRGLCIGVKFLHA